MILKETKFGAADNSGALKMKCIHLYTPQTNQLGNFIQVVLHRFDPRKKLQKKKKYFGLVITTKQTQKRKHGQVIKFSENRTILFGDKQKFLGSRIHGPIGREVKTKLGLQQANKLGSSSSGGFI